MTERTIITHYFAGRTEVRTIRSSDPLRAMQNATGYLIGRRFEDKDKQRDADRVQIVSDDGARIYYELVLRKNGKLETTLDYDPSEFVTPGTLHYFKRKQNGKKT